MEYSIDYWADIARVTHNIPNVDYLYGKTVLITGATGMICSPITDIIVWLNQNYSAGIRLILAGRNREKISSRFAGVLSDLDYEYIEFFATRSQNINLRVDFIIHGASNANPSVYASEPVETLMGNIVGLQNMLELARKNSGSRLIYISSSEVYGKRAMESNQPYKEEEYGYIDILNPRSCYPNGKRAAETLCVCYGQEYGVDSVIVRPGHIYGPTITKTDTRATAEFTRDVVAKRNILMKSAGDQLRSYCYSLDCASAVLAVLINGGSLNAYNISNKASIVSIRRMAEELASQGGVDIIFENPSDAEIKSYNLMTNSSLDSTKIEALGWKAEFGIMDGVNRTLRFIGRL